MPHLPVGGELVLFNRSWYNRAGVESVMGFCTPAERDAFLDDAPHFEPLLVRSGILLRKFYLDIGKEEQERRLADPARNEMFARTHTEFAPWELVRTDDKRQARVALMKAIRASVDYKGKEERLLLVDPDVEFAYDARKVHRLAP